MQGLGVWGFGVWGLGWWPVAKGAARDLAGRAQFKPVEKGVTIAIEPCRSGGSMCR